MGRGFGVVTVESRGDVVLSLSIVVADVDDIVVVVVVVVVVVAVVMIVVVVALVSAVVVAFVSVVVVAGVDPVSWKIAHRTPTTTATRAMRAMMTKKLLAGFDLAQL